MKKNVTQIGSVAVAAITIAGASGQSRQAITDGSAPDF